ncbi:MAG: hypothetical protein ACT4N2_02815 [Hyphomicrobium sp.]
MIRPTLVRALVASLAAAAVAGLSAVDRASFGCLQQGGRFDILRWRCRPIPPVILRRELENVRLPGTSGERRIAARVTLW